MREREREPRARVRAAVSFLRALARVARACVVWQRLVRESADDAKTLSEGERLRAGKFVLGRGDVVKSVSLLLSNSDLAVIPNAGKAADALQPIKRIAKAGKGPLTRSEYLAMARQYRVARTELQHVLGAAGASAKRGPVVRIGATNKAKRHAVTARG